MFSVHVFTQDNHHVPFSECHRPISLGWNNHFPGFPARLPVAKEGFFDWIPEDEEPEGDMDFESSLRGDDLPQ